MRSETNSFSGVGHMGVDATTATQSGVMRSGPGGGDPQPPGQYVVEWQLDRREDRPETAGR